MKNESPEWTDAYLAKLLREQGLEDSPENIELLRSGGVIIKKYFQKLDNGKDPQKVLAEIRLNSLRKN